jgi:hypothetical protein
LTKKGKILRPGVTSTGTLERDNWTKEYQLCQCRHVRMAHTTFQDLITKEMRTICDMCNCQNFLQIEKNS